MNGRDWTSNVKNELKKWQLFGMKNDYIMVLKSYTNILDNYIKMLDSNIAFQFAGNGNERNCEASSP